MSKRSEQLICGAMLPVALALLVLPGGSCSPPPSTLTVFAAAGSKPPLDEICQKFGEECQTRVEISYSGGGEALNQMVLSRSGDVYIAPEQRFMETAQEKQSIEPRTIQSAAYMIPVIAVPEGNPANIVSLADLARPGVRVAVARPETTLLGKYTPEIFDKAGLSGEIGKNIITEAARPDNLLTMLVMRQVDAAIIWHFYRVQASGDIEIIFLPPEQLTGIGEMQLAVTTYCQDSKTAQKFIDFVTSADSKEIFRKHGYLTDAEEVKQYWR